MRSQPHFGVPCLRCTPVVPKPANVCRAADPPPPGAPSGPPCHAIATGRRRGEAAPCREDRRRRCRRRAKPSRGQDSRMSRQAQQAPDIPSGRWHAVTACRPDHRHRSRRPRWRARGHHWGGWFPQVALSGRDARSWRKPATPLQHAAGAHRPARPRRNRRRPPCASRDRGADWPSPVPRRPPAARSLGNRPTHRRCGAEGSRRGRRY